MPKQKKQECNVFKVKRPINIYPGTDDEPKFVYYPIQDIGLTDKLVEKGILEEIKEPPTKAKKEVNNG